MLKLLCAAAAAGLAVAPASAVMFTLAPGQIQEIRLPNGVSQFSTFAFRGRGSDDVFSYTLYGCVYEAAVNQCSYKERGGWGDVAQPDEQSKVIDYNRFGTADVSMTLSSAPTNTSVIEFTFTQSGVALVPESAAWAMMVVGFGLVGATLRRRPVAFA